MSSARRAYDILRGYVSHGWETLQGGEETDAERELREAMEQSPVPQPAANQGATMSPPDPPMTLEAARRLLDVGPEATSKQIDASFAEFRDLVNPDKFAEGSAARDRARQLQQRLDAAKKVLQENMDPTIRRFEGLEID